MNSFSTRSKRAKRSIPQFQDSRFARILQILCGARAHEAHSAKLMKTDLKVKGPYTESKDCVFTASVIRLRSHTNFIMTCNMLSPKTVVLPSGKNAVSTLAAFGLVM